MLKSLFLGVIIPLVLWGQTISISIQDSLLGIIGGEDITIDQNSGIAFISSLDRRVFFKTKELINGNIYIYDFVNEEAIPQPVTLNIQFPFQPHGIFLLKKGDEKYLFVVNHYSHKKSRIERFRIEGKELFWEKSFENDHFYSPNDICAIDKDKFFITNDQKNRKFFFKLIEGILKLRSGNIVFYDGTTAKVAYHKKIGFANGIQYDSKNNLLFVGASIEKALYSFNVKDDFSLEKNNKIKLNSAVDNLEWDSNGNLWAVGHTKIFKFTLNSLNPDKKSPWDVFFIPADQLTNLQKDKISKYHYGKKQLKETPFSTASVIAVYKDKGLIGSVFEKYILLVNVKLEQ